MRKFFCMLVPTAMFFVGCVSESDTTRESDYLHRSYTPHLNTRAKAKSAPSDMASDRVSVDASGSSGYFQESSRMMAYTAGFTLVVREQAKAQDELKQLAEKLGGYLVSISRNNMRVKIPVKKADEFLKTSGSFGKMSDFRISAEDLTDMITDLGVRLDNLRKLRARLTELLKKAQKVEDMLKVERELNRITTEIERLDAQLQNNKNRVAFVTVDVALIVEHGAMPGGNPEAVKRFTFLRKLVSSNPGEEDEALFDLTVPDSLVPVVGDDDDSGFAATTSDNCIFRSWEAKIPEKSKLEFWQDLYCQALQSYFSFEKIKVFPVKFNGKNAVKITAERTTSKGVESYFAVISIERKWHDYLQIVEFFGPSAAFAKYEKAVSEAVLK